MKKYFYIITLTAICSLGLTRSPMILRTIAMSALNQVSSLFESSIQNMIPDPEAGGDISYVCAVNIMKDWGTVIYNSVVAVPDLTSPDILGKYMNTLDAANRSVRKLASFRSDLEPRTRQEINASYSNGKMTAAPTDLSFNNFANLSTKFFGTLSVCISTEFIEVVKRDLKPLDFDEVTPASNDIDIIQPISSISIGSTINPSKLISIPIRDNTKDLHGSGTYRDFVFKILTR